MAHDPRYEAKPLTYANNNRGYSTPLEDGPHSAPNSYRRSNTPAPSKLRDPSDPSKLAERTSREEATRSHDQYSTGYVDGQSEVFAVAADPKLSPSGSAERSLTRGKMPRFFRSFIPAKDTTERVLSGRKYSQAVWQPLNGAKFGMQPPRHNRRISGYTDPVATPSTPEYGARLLAGVAPVNTRLRRMGNQI